MRNAIANRFCRNVKPDGKIERSAMPLQHGLQRFGLRNGAREAVKDKTVRAVKPHVILDQFDDDLVRHQFAVLGLLRDFEAEQGPEFHLAANDRA